MKLQFVLILILFCSSTSIAKLSDGDSLFLKPGKFINSDHPAIKTKAFSLIKDCASEEMKVKRIYEFVRDSYSDSVYESHYASDVLSSGGNSCYRRAILLAALCRASGIPSRLHWQKVILKDYSYEGKTADYIFIHGITGIKYNGRWYLYEPVGNEAKWKVWVQNNEKNMVEFKSNSDCLFSSTEKVLIETLPVYFSDYDEIFPSIYDKLTSGEMVLQNVVNN